MDPAPTSPVPERKPHHFQPGHDPRRMNRKGTHNRNPALVRDMILKALENQPGGGVKYLEKQARMNPKAFLMLLAKVLPTQIVGANGQSPPMIVLTPDLLSQWPEEQIERLALAMHEARTVDVVPVEKEAT